jgi:hypothetical protein
MDPNANLAEQRRILDKLRNPFDAYTEEELSLLRRLAELVEAMDEWLTKGGFFPKKWGVRFTDESSGDFRLGFPKK